VLQDPLPKELSEMSSHLASSSDEALFVAGCEQLVLSVFLETLLASFEAFQSGPCTLILEFTKAL
jgi:hypothetical protein